MKRLIRSATLLFCVFLCGFSAFAQVTSTQEPTAGKAVYIAGNPDLYPLEFYNEETECYEGILPTLYAQISDQTGYDFSYVSADNKSRQKELAENCQVEIVSAYHKGDLSAEKEIELFSYTKNGKAFTVCIGFTKIIDADLAGAVETALHSADERAWLSAAMELERKPNATKMIIILAIVAAVLLLGILFFIGHILQSKRKKIRQQNVRMIDEVTGIGNREYFEDNYLHHISEMMRPLYYVAYIAIDIEKIETYFGAQQSEELQRYAAASITNAMGDNDFAARIDNGVFAACYMCPDPQRAIKNATELLDDLNAYSQHVAKDSGLLFRCGLYMLGKEHTPYETAIYNARQGYLAAANDKQLVRVCDKDVLDRVSLKSKLQKKIASALENEEFQIYLQFVVETKNKQICGAEVLSRWHNLEEGVLSPANYIEDMKLAGMIDQLDFYILDKTCQMLSAWKDTKYKNLYLSCNFTRTTLSLEKLAETFEEILSQYDFNRENLLIELTEDSFAKDSTVAYKNVLAIKNLGCKVVLDDFGSGYTSFSDLCDYPVDIIKIDRHMVIKSASNRGAAVLIGMIRMAHALGIGVLCEGVETEAESKKVVEAECDYIQGFLYSRVLPSENAMDFYDKQ